ncbi:MAG: tetratricopeptide repeat protein [Nitrospiraceae bacterium]
MAKKGYPGLVLVPPSDRTILRRRLLFCALFIIALVWGASTLGVWPLVSDNRANCQPGVGQEGSNSPAEKCGQPQSATEPLPNQNEFSLTPLSQAEGLAESNNPPPSRPLDPDQHTPHSKHSQDLTPQSSEPADRPADHSVVSPTSEKITSHMPASKPAHDQDRDVHVADRVTPQHHHSQNSTPKSSELINHPIDLNIASSANTQSTVSSSTSRPVQGSDIDARLAEQGDVFAQYRLGRYYAQQDGRQAPESVSWYKKASPGLHRLAQTGNGQAMYVLGVMYAYGRGVPRSTDEARRWLTMAVEHKITAAQPVLASLEVHHTTHSKPQVSAQGKR